MKAKFTEWGPMRTLLMVEFYLVSLLLTACTPTFNWSSINSSDRELPHSQSESLNNSWANSLLESQGLELALAMESISVQITEEGLAGSRIPVSVSLSRTRIREGSKEGLSVTFTRQDKLGFPFNLSIQLSGRGDAKDLHSEQNWSQVAFAAHDRSKTIHFQALDDGISEGTENVLLNISAPAFVQPQQQQVGFLIEDANYKFSSDKLAFIVRAGTEGEPHEGESAMTSYAANPAAAPKFVAQAFAGKGGFLFDGKQQYLMINNHKLINTAKSYQQKTFMFVFQTGDDIERRQMIYEQGDHRRGFNAYLDKGMLYLGAYNLKPSTAKGTEASWQPAYLSIPVRENSSYVAVMEFDAESGTLTGWINGLKAAVIADIGAMPAHPGKIGLGAVNDFSRFHDELEAKDGYYFAGSIHKVLSYNRLLPEDELQSLIHQTMDEAGLYEQPILRMVSLNQAREGRDESVQVELLLNYSASQDIKLQSIIAGQVNVGKDIIAAPSELIPAFATRKTIEFKLLDDNVIENDETMILSFHDSADLIQDQPYLMITIEDDDGLDIRENISLWLGAESQELRSYKSSGTKLKALGNIAEPTLDTSTFFSNSLHFSGKEILQLAEHPSLNLAGPYSGKSIAMALRTGSDVKKQQVIYKQGHAKCGLNLTIEDGYLRFHAYHFGEDHKPGWGLAYAEQPIEPFTSYYLVGVMAADEKRLTLFLNGKAVDSKQKIAALPSHPGPSTIGGTLLAVPTRQGKIQNSYFSGEIAEIIILNKALTTRRVHSIFEYWERKY